jgi:hypothetical protein
MVFLPTHRQPKPWAAYATAAIVLHGLTIALILNGAANGPQGDPMEVELVELDPASADPFAAPSANPLPPEEAPIDPFTTPTEPDRTLPAEPTSTDPTSSDPTITDPTITDPAPADPAPAEQAPADPAFGDPTIVDSAQPNPVQPNPAQPNPAQPNPVQPNPVQPNPAQPNPAQPNPAQPNPVQPNPVQPNPADVPQGEVKVSSQSQGVRQGNGSGQSKGGIGLNVGLEITSHGDDDIPFGPQAKRATPKQPNQQFILDPSTSDCISTPEADRDMGQSVTLNLVINDQGQVTDVTQISTNSLSSDYIALAQCIVKQWAFDPAIDQTEQGTTIPRPDNATVTLTLQSQAL